jgi:hypothetical protein
MWSATKKIVAAAAVATVLGLAVGYGTGLLLGPLGSGLQALTGLSFQALTTFPPSNVAVFFGVSGGLMAATTKSLEFLGFNATSPGSAEPSATAEKEASQGKSPTLDTPTIHQPTALQAAQFAPVAQVQAAQHAGLVTADALISPLIH